MKDSSPPAPRRRWWLRVLLIFLALGLAGVAVFGGLLWSWTDVERMSSAEAEAAFVEALRLAGGGPAYLELDDDEEVVVRRELERAEASRQIGLHLLAWEPDEERLVRFDLPGWFLRIKTRASGGIESIVREHGGRWPHGGELTSEELARFGHGLILDRTFENGMRLLIWQEAEPR